MPKVTEQPLKGGQGLCFCSSIKEASAKVAEIWICSLSSQPILQAESAIQARCKANSMANFSKGINQSFFYEQQASNHATHVLDLTEVAIGMGMPKNQRPWILGKTFITRPQNVKENVAAWLSKFTVSEVVVDSSMSPSWKRIRAFYLTQWKTPVTVIQTWRMITALSAPTNPSSRVRGRFGTL